MTNTADIEQLNKSFSIQNENTVLYFNPGEGNIPQVEIKNQLASARISLQGAHLLSWIPEGEEDVIWLSEDASFAAGKSVRGGIPICWPWFGAHESNASFPAHGYARTVMWQVTSTEQLATGETQISFKLETNQLDDKYQQMWPQQTLVEYTVTIGNSLMLELTTHNNSDQPITIGQALHTYFNVGDVTNTMVYGLETKVYIDKPDNFKRKKQIGPVEFNAEVDRVYLQTPDDILIKTKERKIIIKKQGSESTVVWNPWKEVAEKMGDLGECGYLEMLCVESANAADDVREVQAGASHKLLVKYEIEN
ncbi:MAG: D-hexose-6-phosphate mutarotase [Gammaproteobacteria bacterium]|nr:D-hexose-6-phosphate mutarotase [Gammaproteobacteria bacterium]